MIECSVMRVFLTKTVLTCISENGSRSWCSVVGMLMLFFGMLFDLLLLKMVKGGLSGGEIGANCTSGCSGQMACTFW